MLRLLNSAARAVREHAESCYPLECGGLLVGTEAGGIRTIEMTAALDNQSLQPERHVRLDPLEVWRVERAAWQSGLGVWGFYHSHPDCPPTPSARDLSEAGLLDWSHLIIQVSAGQAGLMQSWILRGDRESFLEEKIQIITRR